MRTVFALAVAVAVFAASTPASASPQPEDEAAEEMLVVTAEDADGEMDPSAFASRSGFVDDSALEARSNRYRTSQSYARFGSGDSSGQSRKRSPPKAQSGQNRRQGTAQQDPEDHVSGEFFVYSYPLFE